MNFEILQKMGAKAGCKIAVGLEKRAGCEHLSGIRTKEEGTGIDVIFLRSLEACDGVGEFLITFIHELLHVLCKDDHEKQTAFIPILNGKQ